MGLTASPATCSTSETATCSDTLEILTDWTKAAIDEFNMASHDGPKLYFAGYTSPWSSNWQYYLAGITIESFKFCSDQNLIQPASPRDAYFALTITQNTGTKSKVQLVRGGPKACAGENDHEPLKNYYWWVNPGDDDDNKSTNHDYVGVLIHEFGHALGLKHTDSSTVLGNHCSGVGNSVASAAVMHPGNKDFRRRLRRDDIEGLRALWGAPERSLFAAKNTTPGALAANWGVQSQVGSLLVNTPPTISDAARNNESNLQVAATNSDDEVFYLLGNSFSISSGGNYVTSGAGSSGVRVRSFDPVGIARGRRSSDNYLRIAVAWLGDANSAALRESEDPNNPDNRIWWKVFSQSGWLTPKYSGLTKYKEFGLSYDPISDLFVLVYIDTCSGTETCPTPNPSSERPGDSWAYVLTFSGSTGNHVCTQALTTAEHVLHVGSPACDVRTGMPTQCHIPVVTSAIAGPTLRVLEGTIDEHPVHQVDCWLRDAEPDPPPLTTSLNSYGPLWMAMNGATTNGAALFSHVPELSTSTPQNDDYSELFVMSRDANGLLTGNMSQQIRMRSDYWPIAVGSLSRTTSPNTVWWAVTGY